MAIKVILPRLNSYKQTKRSE